MKTIAISDETYEKIKEQVEKDKKEAKPEIRHTAYGFDGDGRKRLYLKGDGGPNRYANEISMWNNRLTAENVCGKLTDTGAIIIGNLFDELEGMDVEMEEYKGKSDYGTPFVADITCR